MNKSAQYSALTRLLTHNNKVHQLEDLLLRLPAPLAAGSASPELDDNAIADLQDDIDREVRASLVASWFAMPRELDDLEEV